MYSSNSQYDVFISYAREDIKWVLKYLYEPLLQCRTIDGRHPKVFLDNGDTGIQIGDNYMVKIVNSIQNSLKLVPVYSQDYFRKEMCQYELSMAQILDPLGRRGIINPILIDKLAEQQIPLSFKLINYCSTDSEIWFDQLCISLELTKELKTIILSFVNPIENITVNHTLNPVLVQLQDEVSEDIEVTLEMEQGELQGTLTIETVGGTATFSDLSVGTVSPQTQLVARARGAEPTRSSVFSVKAPITSPIITEDSVTPSTDVSIPSQGDAIFFADGKALIVIEQNGIRGYETNGNPFEFSKSQPLTLVNRLRVIRRADSLMALADWVGNVYLLCSEGSKVVFSFCNATRGGFTVPGDIFILDNRIYVGFWNGRVIRLSLNERPVVELRHESGVQLLAVAGERIYVCGLDGKLYVYNKDRRLICPGITLEPCIHALKAYPDCLIAIGEQQAYQIKLNDLRAIPEELPLSDAIAVLAESDNPVIIDSQGKGLYINSDLVFQKSFVTTVGAIPTSCDRQGRYCVFRNPDNSRTLMVDGRIRFSHLAGTLALALDENVCALGDNSHIRILPISTLLDTEEESSTYGSTVA